jgi:2-polyprenyl-3-methyl-5-hydroxy-6-metoxy-1,4-benzoquinol methylase
MAEFIQIPKDYLQEISTGNERIPSLYYSKYGLVREFFWLRLRVIYNLLSMCPSGFHSCLDFGGGSGVFLPTLSGRFERVFCIDLHTEEAAKVIEKYQLKNVKLLQSDITNTTIREAPFDVIIAADVLEHFEDLGPAITALRLWLKPDGYLFTSVPSENYIYSTLRRLFNVPVPKDHYHQGHKIERILSEAGFTRIKSRAVPFGLNIAPLFFISAWQKKPPSPLINNPA